MAETGPISFGGVEQADDIWEKAKDILRMTVAVMVQFKLLQVWEILDFGHQPVVRADCKGGHASIKL